MSDDLSKVLNTPGYGKGKIVRDQLAENARCMQLLPRRENVAEVQARSGDGGYMVPVAHFGNSCDDGKDWSLYHGGTDDLSGAFGHDAKQDAETISAIVNAYRLGLIVPATTIEAAVKAEREALDALIEAKNALDGEPDYHDEGMGCGLEDRNITDRYEAMQFGWEEAMERAYSEHVNGAVEIIDTAIRARGGEV